MVICLERGADLHTAQLMPLPLTVSCFSEIQIGFTFLVPAHLGSPGKRAVKRVCMLNGCMIQYGVLSNTRHIICRFLPVSGRDRESAEREQTDDHDDDDANVSS